ncbi:MAG: tetratricopeptide repeat protein [Chthoniobacterales bacterium]
MKIRKLTAIPLLFLAILVLSGAAPEKSRLESMYDKAFQAFDSANYDEALKALDAIDAQQPDLAESLNLRGVVYMRQGKYDKAETALRKALSLEPKFWNASFNLAEIPFLKRDWPEARKRFEALVAGEHEGLQPETSQLIQYKILLTFVLEGKENMVDWILNKFELAKDSPALYYSNAAIAYEHKNDKEAKEWMSAAGKHFSESLNKLYAESFYEVGWLQKPAGEARPAIEITSTAERAEQLKAEATADFEKAERALQQRDFEGALKLLDLADAAAPNDAQNENLRGEVLMEQGKFDEAEATFHKAVADDPKLREAQYNLAQIPFKQGDYEKARDRFEALFAETPGDDKNQAAQLIKYKIFLTLLLQGKDTEAQQLMDQFKFTGDTPALYYAHAAWEYKHGHQDQGSDWVNSARRIYSPALNVVFADSFYDLTWLKKTEESEPPPTSALAQADASPAKEAAPEMRLGQAEPIPPPVVAEQSAAPTGTPGATPAKVAAKVASPAPTAASTAMPAAGSTALVATQASAAPVVARASAAPVAATKKAATSTATSRPAPAPAPAASSTFAGLVESVSRSGTWLVGGVLLAGIAWLVWLVVQQARRSVATVSPYQAPAPLAAPRFLDEEPPLRAERKPARGLVSTGPPKVSLNLKASEPAVRAAVLTAAAVTARGAGAGVTESMGVSPNESIPARPEVVPAPIAAEQVPTEAQVPPFREKEEVLLPEMASVATAGLAAAEGTALAKPVAEKSEAAPPTPPEKEAILEPVIAGSVGEKAFPEMVEAVSAPSEEAALEPVGQGQPVPELTTALSAEPVISELTQPEPESPLELIEPEIGVPTPIAGHRPLYSAIETPSFASKIISTEPIRLQPTTPVTMPETTITPASAPAYRAPAPTMSVQQPAGGMHTAVQLTFSLEIASMQLTPTFKMSGLQLKPTSKVVSMRLAPSQDPQPPMNLQVTFEVAKIELSNGAISTVRLSPSGQQKPAVLTSPSFAISGLELVAGSGAAPVQLTPSHQEQASVHLTAEFQISAIEFTPIFEIATIVLNASSKKVSMQLPGSGPSSIDNAPVFEIENVQLGPGNELGLIQVTPGVAARGA